MRPPPDGWTPAIARTSAAAIDLALSLLPAAPAPDGRVYKTDRDYATTTDYLIEDRVREFLDHATPDIGCLGEERGHTGNTETYWCLDPIDGTTNYAHGIPLHGVSLALIQDEQPIHGEIALPILGERYQTTAQGSELNGRPIHVRHTESVAEAVVSVGDFATGASAERHNADRLVTIARLAGAIGRIRMFGSAATDLAWLAAGRIDAVIMHSNKLWDVGAGVAIARGAGAAVLDRTGLLYTIRARDLIALSPQTLLTERALYVPT